MISPFFKIVGNLPLLIILFKKSEIYAGKISGISVICIDFLAFNLLIFLKTSLTLTPQKQKPDPFLAFLMTMILGWILYLSTALKIG